MVSKLTLIIVCYTDHMFTSSTTIAPVRATATTTPAYLNAFPYILAGQGDGVSLVQPDHRLVVSSQS